MSTTQLPAAHTYLLKVLRRDRALFAKTARDTRPHLSWADVDDVLGETAVRICRIRTIHPDLAAAILAGAPEAEKRSRAYIRRIVVRSAYDACGLAADLTEEGEVELSDEGVGAAEVEGGRDGQALIAEAKLPPDVAKVVELVCRGWGWRAAACELAPDVLAAEALAARTRRALERLGALAARAA